MTTCVMSADLKRTRSALGAHTQTHRHTSTHTPARHTHLSAPHDHIHLSQYGLKNHIRQPTQTGRSHHKTSEHTLASTNMAVPLASVCVLHSYGVIDQPTTNRRFQCTQFVHV
mmetsp:Transcript_13733/g.39556  ORF Transcript_13733/g.39556 Transcript_13733/m.39556 type:complete len:113 (-) Transcript_13733:1499-1837(-)